MKTGYEQFLELIEEVPFGNSDWQNRNAIVNDEKTPARAYRHAALRIMNRLQALKELKYNKAKQAIEIRILKRDMANELDELKRELIVLEIEHKTSSEAYTKKLANDAIKEIQCLWPIIESLGKLSREAFESQEAIHFEKKANIKSLENDLYNEIISHRLGHDSQALPDLSSIIGAIE